MHILRIGVFLLLATTLVGQRRVDPRYTYVRVITVEPLRGVGTAADPKRPGYAPATLAAPGQAQGGGGLRAVLGAGGAAGDPVADAAEREWVRGDVPADGGGRRRRE